MLNSNRPEADFAKSKRKPEPGATGRAGFTLVEMLVAMAAASIMLAAVVSLFTALNKSYTRQNVAANTQQVARAGVDFMAEFIRMAGLNPRQSPGFGITEAAANSITFTADLDLDGSVAGTGETIRFRLIGDELQTSLSAVPLVDNVTALSFTYLAADDSILAAPVVDLDAIRTVQIALTVWDTAGRDETVVRTYSTEVRCRNMGI